MMDVGVMNADAFGPLLEERGRVEWKSDSTTGNVLRLMASNALV
jgi:hypothetical protein